MGTTAEQTAKQLLEGIVSDELLVPYTVLLARAGCLLEEAEELLGGPERVKALTDSGMAHIRGGGPALPPQVMPTPPNLALQGALANLARRLTTEHERLLDGHKRMLDAHPSSSVVTGGGAERLVQIVTDRDEITDLSRSLISTARRDWMSLDNYVLEASVDEFITLSPPPSHEGEVRCRAIYEMRCAEHPVGARAIEVAVAAGEEARLLPRIGMKMQIVDEAIALLPLTPTGLSGALLVRSSVIVEALREYFELLWERAIPFGAARADSPLSPLQQKILSMMAEGLTDEGISRRAGVSLSTVRRHSAVIREKLGFESRFAAGVAAVRRGWLG
ncbi:helix-turn-helix transcriptional regulator [Actinomadura latina]|uniref:Helix-turn-helix transcriptional regulator n=1 Tax=Actinomadura latina TaxID=163603 RepID=A0A846YXE6_9ACTN|nr:helix-turn-helix transcriptional regulator [Actinomadura latina]NKZ03264.1 helix-turn-helix transcriptional regulator [Actinomadura latina]